MEFPASINSQDKNNFKGYGIRCRKYWPKSIFTRKILYFLLSPKWNSEINRSKVWYSYWKRN